MNKRNLIAELYWDNLQLFAEQIFPAHTTHPFSPLHLHLFHRRALKTQLPLTQRPPALEITLAPRGAAKTTLMTLIFPLHALLYQTERYIVILSATQRQATRRLENIRHELMTNPLLRRTFPRWTKM